MLRWRVHSTAVPFALDKAGGGVFVRAVAKCLVMMAHVVQDVEVSGDCLDMLTRVLVAAPAKRMSMEQIKAHRWFLKGLPPGALEMNDFLLQGLAGQEEVCACHACMHTPTSCQALLFFGQPDLLYPGMAAIFGCVSGRGQ